MTPQQLAVLRLIDGHIERTRVPPSYQEIADALGVASKSGVHRLVGALVDRGYLKKEGRNSVMRVLAVTGSGRAALGLAPAHPVGLGQFSTEQLIAELKRRHDAGES